jgi:hypothetical protein
MSEHCTILVHFPVDMTAPDPPGRAVYLLAQFIASGANKDGFRDYANVESDIASGVVTVRRQA